MDSIDGGGSVVRFFLRTFLAIIFLLLFVTPVHADNPVIKQHFSADPAAIVHNGKVYLYTGHDQATISDNFFVLKKWSIYSSDDMENWTFEGSVPRTIFKWGTGDSAWASEVIERDGQFYWYTTVRDSNPNSKGYAIGVATSDHPVKGWTDALGHPLVKSTDTEHPDFMGNDPWDDIDPTVLIDDNGQAHLYWGNTHLYYAKLKDNMIEIDGEIKRVTIEDLRGSFTEGPFVFKNDNHYYMLFALNYPEELGYATSPSPDGPWTYRGKIMDTLWNSATSHPAALEFKDKWYLIYHTAALPTGGEFRRSVSIEPFDFLEDGSIPKIIPTASGVTHPSFSLQTYQDPSRFVRHANFSFRADQVKGNYYDYKWHLTKGLATKEDNYVSIQAENLPGFYITYNGSQIVLRKHDGTEGFKQAATFRVVEGLADSSWVSIQPMDTDKIFVLLNDNHTLEAAEIKTKVDKGRATFRFRFGDAEEIRVDKDILYLQKGDSVKVIASLYPENTLAKIDLVSQDPEIASIDTTAGYLIKGEKAGETSIFLHSTDKRARNIIEVQILEKLHDMLDSFQLSVDSLTNKWTVKGVVNEEILKTIKVFLPNGEPLFSSTVDFEDNGSFYVEEEIDDRVEGTYQAQFLGDDEELLWELSVPVSKSNHDIQTVMQDNLLSFSPILKESVIKTLNEADDPRKASLGPWTIYMITVIILLGLLYLVWNRKQD